MEALAVFDWSDILREKTEVDSYKFTHHKHRHQMTARKSNPLPRSQRGQGRKPGPNGPADARLSIKCTKAEMASYTAAAKSQKISRSAWIKKTLNGAQAIGTTATCAPIK